MGCAAWMTKTTEWCPCKYSYMGKTSVTDSQAAADTRVALRKPQK